MVPGLIITLKSASRKLLSVLLMCFVCSVGMAESTRTARQVFNDLILSDTASRHTLLDELAQYGDPVIASIYESWRTGGIYTSGEGESRRILQFAAEQWTLVASGEHVSLSDAELASAQKNACVAVGAQSDEEPAGYLGIESGRSAGADQFGDQNGTKPKGRLRACIRRAPQGRDRCYCEGCDSRGVGN